MVAGYTHPTEERKQEALGTFRLPTAVGTLPSQIATASDVEAAEIAELLRGRVVDAARIELATSALRTRRSPS
jgi:hypothetical protein